MALTLYRRHAATCPGNLKENSRAWKQCQCPIWADGTLGTDDAGTPLEYRKSLKTRDWNKAVERVAELEKKPKYNRGPGRVLFIQMAIDTYRRSLATRKLAKSTLAKHKLETKVLEDFFESINVNRLDRITPENCQQFYNSWTLSPSTTDARLTRLKSFFRYCVKIGWIDANPAEGLKPPKVPKTDTLPFEPEELERIFAALDNYHENHRKVHHPLAGPDFRERLKGLVLVMRWTGLRISDAVSLRRDAVVDHSIRVKTTKSGKHVYVPIPDEVSKALKRFTPRSDEHFFITGESDLVGAVGSYRRSLSRVFKDAKVVKGHPHRFRDTFAVDLLNTGAELHEVQMVLGHESIKTTERHYAPFVKSRQKRLTEAVSRLWATPQNVAWSVHPL